MLKQYQKSGQRKLLATALRMKGYLEKKSKKMMSKYQRRFFVILDNTLSYSTDETLDDIRKQFYLSDIKDLRKEDELQFCFFYRTKEYILRAETQKQLDDWVSSLNLILNCVETVKREVTFNEQDAISKILKIESQETIFEANIRATFYSLGLRQLAQEFHQDYIKCRVAAHMCTRGCLFMVCCKSLTKHITDQKILPNTYMEPYELNTIYLFDVKAQTCQKILACEELVEIVLIGRSLRVNSISTNLTYQKSQFTQGFIDKIKASVGIAKEYRNKENITLRQNVDSLVEMFLNKQDRLQKHHIKSKLLDEYISMLQPFGSGYKRVYSKFQELIRELTSRIEDTLNAISLKEQDLRGLSVQYSIFYYQKMHKLFKTFWNQNCETITIQDLISLVSLSYDYYLAVTKYIQDDSNIHINGVRTLRDHFIKKMLTDIEASTKKQLNEKDVFSLTVVHTTNLPFEFMKILQAKADIIATYCNSEEIGLESLKLLLEAAVLILVNELETKITLYNSKENLLVAFCNDNWIYGKQMAYMFPKIDLTEVNKILGVFHKSLVKRLYQYLSPFKQIQFLSINMAEFSQKVKLAIKGLADMNTTSLKEIKNRVGEEFNNLYFRSLVNAAEKKIIFKTTTDLMINKITQDFGEIRKVFQQDAAEKVEKLIKTLEQLFTDVSDEGFKQCYMNLKFNVSLEDFRQNDIKSLLLLKHLPEEAQRKLELLCSIDAISEEQSQDQPSKSTIMRPRRETHQRTEAELLIKNDIDYEGYMQKKKNSAYEGQAGYNLEYFKLTSECLLWYTNSNSQNLIDRIFITDIKEIYLHPKHPQRFVIDMKNCIKHKFKTCSMEIALKWVEKLNHSTAQPKAASLRNISQEDIFTNFFEDLWKIKNRPSLLSNHRNYQQSKLTTEDSSSPSPIKNSVNKPKSKFTFASLLGCSSTE